MSYRYVLIEPSAVFIADEIATRLQSVDAEKRSKPREGTLAGAEQPRSILPRTYL